jgi:hypothetical protein
VNGADSISLWAQLRQAGLVEGEVPPDAASLTPWYIRTMLGIAGWVGAMFLLGFVGAAFSIVMKSAAAGLLVGAVLCAAATIMFRGRPNGDFICQFALAVSIAGQSLTCVGLAQLLHADIALIACLFAAFEIALFLLVPNFLHRVLVSAGAAGALVVAMAVWGLFPYTQAVIFAAFSWAWLNEFRFPTRSAELRALGYGLALLLFTGLVTERSTQLLSSAWSGHGALPLIGGPYAFWIGAGLSGAIMLWVVWGLLVRQGIAITQGPGLAALAGAALVALITVKAPGFGITVSVLLLGFANGNRVLAGVGILALLAYWSYYYYSLEISLLQKSALLLCAGVVLIAARLAMKRTWPTNQNEARNA